VPPRTKRIRFKGSSDRRATLLKRGLCRVRRRRGQAGTLTYNPHGAHQVPPVRLAPFAFSDGIQLSLADFDDPVTGRQVSAGTRGAVRGDDELP